MTSPEDKIYPPERQDLYSISVHRSHFSQAIRKEEASSQDDSKRAFSSEALQSMQHLSYHLALGYCT